MCARVAAWLVVVGCGTTPSQSLETQVMRTAIADAYDEAMLYVDDVHEMVALPGILDEAERHRVRMVSLLGDLESGVATITPCMDPTAVNSARRELTLELQLHVSAVYAEPTVDTARREVDRHVGVTNQLLGEIDTLLDANACITR